MRKFVGAVVAFLFFLFFLFSCTTDESRAETCNPWCHDDYHDIVFAKDPPPDGWYEQVVGVTRGFAIDWENDVSFPVCVIHTVSIQLELGESVPLDEDGLRMMLDIDGVTYLSTMEVVESVNPDTCGWHEDVTLTVAESVDI